MTSGFSVKAVFGISIVRFFSTGMRLSNSILRKEFRKKLNIGNGSCLGLYPQCPKHVGLLKSYLPAIMAMSQYVERGLSSRTSDRYKMKTHSAFNFPLLLLAILRRNCWPRCSFVSVRNGCSTLLQNTRAISVSAPYANLSKKGEVITIHFFNKDGRKITAKGQTGQNLLDTVLDNDIDIDGYGACEGTLSCSTCHLIFSEDFFNMLPKPTDEELDMLDLAYGQTEKSRLGCQVILTKEMDGMTVTIPEGVADARDA